MSGASAAAGSIVSASLSMGMNLPAGTTADQLLASDAFTAGVSEGIAASLGSSASDVRIVDVRLSGSRRRSLAADSARRLSASVQTVDVDFELEVADPSTAEAALAAHDIASTMETNLATQLAATDFTLDSVLGVKKIQLGVGSVSFTGDVDPKTRSISGTITIQAKKGANGLQGYLLYPSADGSENIAGAPPTHAMNLVKSCPVDGNNEDQDHVTAGNSWATAAGQACNNNSPYSPKCTGASCGKILIKPGSDGEYYITRYDNTADQQTPDSYTTNTRAVRRPRFICQMMGP
jgi:hypothetical protein